MSLRVVADHRVIEQPDGPSEFSATLGPVCFRCEQCIPDSGWWIRALHTLRDLALVSGFHPKRTLTDITHMPNPWTGKGNPYTRKEVCERLRATLKKGNAIIAGGAGTGISAKFIERGGADLIIIYNSGR